MFYSIFGDIEKKEEIIKGLRTLKGF